MTTHQQPTTTPTTALRAAWRLVLQIVHGIDAGALVAHGRPVPPDHPARRRRLDHEEVERRLAELYPRADRPQQAAAQPSSRPSQSRRQASVSATWLNV